MVPEMAPRDGFCVGGVLALDVQAVLDAPELLACSLEGRLVCESADLGEDKGKY